MAGSAGALRGFRKEKGSIWFISYLPLMSMNGNEVHLGLIKKT